MTSLPNRLALLRRRLRWSAAVRGVSCLVAALLVAGMGGALLDWRWHLAALVRATLLTATLLGSGYIAFRFLIQPLSAYTDDLALALRIERHFPWLEDG